MDVDDRPLPGQSIAVLNTMSDEARRGGGYTVRLSATDIERMTGISRRRVYAALRDLRERGLIDVEKSDNRYGHEPNRYTIMPPGKGRVAKVDEVAQRLGVPRAQVAEQLQRLWSVRDSAGTLSIEAFCAQAGWTGDPATFVRALVESGVLRQGRIVW